MKRSCHNVRRCLPILLILISASQLYSSQVNLTSFSTNSSPTPSYQVAVFYYPWYGNPTNDGAWIHWDRDRDHVFFPPFDISSDYYPVLGAYSAIDPAVVSQHFEWSGINPDPRNTLNVQLQAAELNCRLFRNVVFPCLQTLLLYD